MRLVACLRPPSIAESCFWDMTTVPLNPSKKYWFCLLTPPANVLARASALAHAEIWVLRFWRAMSNEKHLQLGRRERQIMDVIYRRGRASVTEVLAELTDPPS